MQIYQLQQSITISSVITSNYLIRLLIQ